MELLSGSFRAQQPNTHFVRTIGRDNRDCCRSLRWGSVIIPTSLQYCAASYKKVLVGCALGLMDQLSFVGRLPSTNRLFLDGRNTSSSKGSMLIKCQILSEDVEIGHSANNWAIVESLRPYLQLFTMFYQGTTKSAVRSFSSSALGHHRRGLIDHCSLTLLLLLGHHH